MKKLILRRNFVITLLIFCIIVINSFIQLPEINQNIDLNKIAITAYADGTAEVDPEEEEPVDPDFPPNSFIDWFIEVIIPSSE